MDNKIYKKDFDKWNVQKKFTHDSENKKHFTNKRYGLLKLAKMLALSKMEKVRNF